MSPRTEVPQTVMTTEPRFDKPEPVDTDDLPPAAMVPHAPMGDPEFMAHR